MKCLKVNFSKLDYANFVHMKLQDEFHHVFMLTNAPEGMAMFSSKGRLEDQSIYLIPSNNELLVAIGRTYNACESTLPSSDNLSPLAGYAVDSLV